ncbi:hypothetical protein ACWEV4_35500, partial [Streptomyces sp. NPDC003860]
MRWSASAVSSAASRPRRFISYTVKMTGQCGACALTSRAVRSASSNLGRTRMRVLIWAAGPVPRSPAAQPPITMFGPDFPYAYDD